MSDNPYQSPVEVIEVHDSVSKYYDGTLRMRIVSMCCAMLSVSLGVLISFDIYKYLDAFRIFFGFFVLLLIAIEVILVYFHWRVCRK